MKILFNTNYVSAATNIGIDQMIPKLEAAGHNIKRNDWNNYQNYDLVFFMSPDSRVAEAKNKNPNILTCIIDPKIVSFFDKIKSKTLWKQPIMRELRFADFLLVSSIEHRDSLLKYNKNPFINYFFPITPKEKKQHTEKKKITIGYHGNKVHLDSMADVSWALDKLSEKYDIEFLAIYNIQKLGKWVMNRPKKCKVIDTQWTSDMAEDLRKCDIGVSPSLQPINIKLGLAFTKYFLNRKFPYSPDDYLFRFKYSNGPGRLYNFAMLGIPVVADATPSQCQFIQDEKSGFICCTKESWYNSLERLIGDANLRKMQGENLFNFIENNYSIEKNFERLMGFINDLQSVKKRQ